MVRRRAGGYRRRGRALELLRCFATTTAAYILFAGTSFSYWRGVRGFATAFAATDRPCTRGEKTEAQIGRAGKCRLAASRWPGDRICPGGFRSSGCLGGDTERGIRAGDGQS